LQVKHKASSRASAFRLGTLLVIAGIATAILAIVMAVGDEDDDTPDDPRVVVVESSDVLELPTATDSRLVLDDTEEHLDAGDFITTEPDWEADSPHTPEGFLLKVKHSKIADDITTVETEPASLFEAEPEEQLNTEDSHFRPVESSAVEEASASLVEVNMGETIFSRASVADASEALTPAGEVKESLHRTFGCGSSGEIEVGGGIDTSLEPDIEFVWSKRRRIPIGIDYAAARVKGTATARLSARAGGDFRCEPDPIVLVEPSWRTVVVVGQVPVPVTVWSAPGFDDT
jgi:hypothetical protein